VFISTHLDHTRDPSDRLSQAKAINEHFTRSIMVPAILAGDFNCEPGSAPMSELEQVWKLATDDAAMPSFPSTRPSIRIDHVLFKPADSWRVVEARVIDEPLASDHRPVLVKLELLSRTR
jgi:endonuclease/exonuclease/phosphatase family metal-dependent hydrolase